MSGSTIRGGQAPTGNETEVIGAFGDFEEIGPGDIGIIFLVFNMSRGQVKGSQMGGEDGDIAPKYFADEFLVEFLMILMSRSAGFLL